MKFFEQREETEVTELPLVTDEAGALAPPQPESSAGGELSEAEIDAFRRGVATSVQEIDAVISELRMMREALHNAESRVRDRALDYAAMSETAMQSSKGICDALQLGLQRFEQERAKRQPRADARGEATGVPVTP